VGPLVSENDTSFGFIGWSYSDSEPIIADYAFNYWVDKKTGKLGSADAPISKKEAKKLYKQYFDNMAKARTFSQVAQQHDAAQP